MYYSQEFRKYATKHRRISNTSLSKYSDFFKLTRDYITLEKQGSKLIANVSTNIIKTTILNHQPA